MEELISIKRGGEHASLAFDTNRVHEVEEQNPFNREGTIPKSSNYVKAEIFSNPSERK